jgi:hypothetical protein
VGGIFFATMALRSASMLLDPPLRRRWPHPPGDGTNLALGLVASALGALHPVLG